MPDRTRTGEAALPPTLNALLRRGEGYGWVSGCGVTQTDNTSAIEVRIGAGQVRVAGVTRDITATTKTLSDGDAQYPRKDLVLVDYQGDVRVLPGEPAAPDPPDREAEFTKSPAPPSTASLDGTLLAEVWVPSGATSNADLAPDDIVDRRIADPGGLGTIPVVDARPTEEELTVTRLWRNTNTGQFEAYAADADAIVSLDTTTEVNFSGPVTRVIEDFESSIKDNWNGGDSTYTYTTPAFEGSAAAYWDEPSNAVDTSLPGDGLPYYPEPGDTIAMAVRPEASDGAAEIGFATPSNDRNEAYRLQAIGDKDLLQLVKYDATGSTTLLGSVSISYSVGTWYLIEVEYDGGGTGTHPFRIYSTTTSSDPGQRDTILAEETSPTTDTDFRSRGLVLRTINDVRVDYLHALTP
jgi:hypothetical protein